MLSAFGQDRKATSGYRPRAINVTSGGVLGDDHESCRAVDVEDVDCSLADWCMAHLDFLATLGLWCEAFGWTHSETDPDDRWVHLQITPPHSGARVFVPNVNPPVWAGRWADTPVFDLS